MESKKTAQKNPEDAPRIPTFWKTTEDVPLSPLALQDFGKYLIGRPEHREGNLTCIQTHIEGPLEVTFFGNDSEDDTVFHIRQDYTKKVFVVVCLRGNSNRIKAPLKEFGLSPLSDATKKITP